jgi:membrane protease YdiL (CAAX protease family)
MSDGSLTVDARLGWMLPGLFAQAGVAEEVLFRGYLFGRVRQHHSFWRACGISMVPFVAVHLWLFLTMPWPIAAASVALAAITSVPLAHLFELGDRTIWPPAILHFAIQAVPKIATVGEGPAFPLAWIAVSAILPLLLLLIGTAPRPAD